MGKPLRDRIKDFRRVKASELRANPKNFRRHPEAQRRVLAGVLEEIGYADALLCREEDDGLVILDGHLRAETTPDQEVPVLVLDVTAEEGDRLMLHLDPLAAMARVDVVAMNKLIEQSGEMATELLATLKDLPVWEEPVIEDLAEAPEPQIDRAAELQEEWGAELGQLWEIPGKAGVHRLLCGDSTKAEDMERVMEGVRVDIVFTDPPYGVDIQERDMQQAEVRGRRKDGLGIQNDNLSGDELAGFLRVVFTGMLSRTKLGACWYVCAPSGVDYRHSLNTLAELDVARHGLVWVKDRFVMGRCDYHYRHENIIYGWTPGGSHHAVPGRDQDSVWQCQRPGRSPEHPTMKPVELVSRAIKNSTENGEAVADPFLGSGTTMVAAEQLGRICYGIEIEPKYVAVCLERMKDMGLQPKLADD